MVLLLPSCTILDIATGFGGMMMPVIKIQRTVNKIEKICKKECRKNNEYSACKQSDVIGQKGLKS